MTNKTVTKIALTAITVPLLTAACAAMTDLDDSEIVLTAFDECGSLLDHLRSEYAELVTSWGFGPRPRPPEGGWRHSPPPKPGLEETDGLFETDGRRIFAVSKGLLSVVDAASRQIGGSARLASEYATELLFDGDDLLVILNDYSPPVMTALDPAADQPAGPDRPVTVVQRVRVDGYRPRVVETLRIDGAYVSARNDDGVARVVTSHDPSWSSPLWYAYSSADERAAEEANRAVVLAGTLENWLPFYAVAPGAGIGPPVEGGLLPACKNVYVPSEFTGFGATTVMSLPMGGPLASHSATAVMAPGDTVYASPRSLYVATQAWIDPEVLREQDIYRQIIMKRPTAVHRFDLSDPARVAYTASGTVSGLIRNQFSLSEHDGHLRVVTTTGAYSWEESQVRVLRETGSRLVEVGSIDDIGRRKGVKSVRFADTVGFVATFSQDDPFYILDLADPQNPAIVGEIKESGFSSYLHPIGDDLVLGVGLNADESTGIKVSLFDISRLGDPQELAVWTAPGRFSKTRYWDHRAFLWWEPAQVAVFGLVDWDDRWAVSVVLQVADGSITEIGRIKNTGSTECRRLDSSPPVGRLKEFLNYYQPNPRPDLIACEPDENPAMVGFDCEPAKQRTQGDAKAYGVVVRGEALVGCQFGRPDIIVRSLVIGDELWTFSYRGGDVYGAVTDDLATLEQTALIKLF